MKKLLMLLFLVSGISLAEQQHHNFTVSTCRVFPSGNFQILGLSENDGKNRILTFSTATFSEKSIDRILSLCTAALLSQTKIRVDYMECNGSNIDSCTPTSSSTLNLYR